MNNDQKKQLLASIPGVIGAHRSKSKNFGPGVIGQGDFEHPPTDHSPITKLYQNDTLGNLEKWAAIPRYLVAELERFGIDRDRAVRVVSCAWANCVTTGESARRVNP